MSADGTGPSDEDQSNYLLWKSHFTKNIDAYYKNKTDEISALYGSIISNIAASYKYAKDPLKSHCYYVTLSSFSVITAQINKLLEFRKKDNVSGRRN